MKTDTNYRAMLKEMESLMTDKPNTMQGEKLDILVTLIETYKCKNFLFDLLDPVKATKFEMKQKGLAISDLESMIEYIKRLL